jgi:cold shock CspA family protein
MALNPQIVFRHVEPTPALEARVRAEVADLERFYERITSCRVAVERSGPHHAKGTLYHVHIDLTVPGGEIVVRHEPMERRAHEDPYVAIGEAFASARRRLEDFAREQRGDVKHHAVEAHGEVVRLEPDGDFGFLRATDGHEVYFHRNSLTRGRFEDLHVGSWVAFHEEDGRDGPQAARFHASGGPRPPSEVLPHPPGTGPRA